MAKLIDLTGQKFNRLTVIERAPNTRHGGTQWFCRCECDRESVVRSFDLRKNRTKSCSCLRNELTIERSTIHGHDCRGRTTKAYYRWKNLRSRKKTALTFSDYLTAQEQNSEPVLTSLANTNSKQNI